MNVLNDNWLDGFVKHPIFQVNRDSQELIHKISAKKTRSTDPTGDFSLQQHSRLITLRDTDLFVAVGSEIRVLNLTTCKNNWIKEAQQIGNSWIDSTPYFILNTPEINFPVESLTANKNGRLLAAKGNNKLVVICLPRQGFANYSEHASVKKVFCRTLSVGTSYYDNGKSDILKIEWHPLSETHTHIVVLGTDNYLRMFDISVDIEEPEQFFDLSPVQIKKEDKNKPKVGFSFEDDDNTDEDAVSFSLGGISKDSSGWEPFTVFYTLRNGHIYALCPVVPYRSSVRRSHLASLSCIAYAKYEQSKKSDSEDSKTLSYLYHLQWSWVSALQQSAKITSKNHKTNLDADTLTVTSDADHNTYPVQRQGPFLVSQNVNLQAGAEATSILYINVSPLNIIALAFTDGTIHNYIVGSEVDPQWQMPMHNPKNPLQKKLGYLLSDSSFLPSASLYESLNVKSAASPRYQSIVLVADPLYEDTFYAYHSAGVHAVSVNKWAQSLGKITTNYEAGQSQESRSALEAWFKEKATSEVRLLIDSSPFSEGFVPIVGLVVTTDMFLSYSVLALTESYQMVVRDLYIRRDPSTSKESRDAIKQQLKSLQDEENNEGEAYQSLLPLPAYQPPAQLNSLPKQPKIVIPPNLNGSKEIVVNEETLRFFSNSSIEIRREARDIKKIATKIDARLSIQQKEFERQVKSLRELYSRLQKANSPEAKAARNDKLEKLCQNHAKLRLRIDEQLRSLMQSYQPDLSNEEKSWIAKLEKISEKVSGDSGYGARVDLLRSQITQLKPGAISREKLSNLNATQLETILRTLKQQSITIDEVEKKYKGLENQLSLTTA